MLGAVGDDEGMDERIVEVDGEIRLGQFLKLAGLAESGAQARDMLLDSLITVDGVIEHQRGRRLVPGTVVALDGPAGSATIIVGPV